jgi:hypothetical protein
MVSRNALNRGRVFDLQTSATITEEIAPSADIQVMLAAWQSLVFGADTLLSAQRA